MATIQKRGKGYRITVSCGYDLNGRQIRRTRTWTPAPDMTARQIQKELGRQTVLFEEQCHSGQVLNGSIRFADFVALWLTDYAEKQLRPITVAGYRHFLKRILPAIGHIRMDALRPHHLMALYDNLAEAGIREDVHYHCTVNFKALQKERGLTAAKLADMAGLGINTIYEINRGKNVKAETARKLEAALDLTTPIFEPVDANRPLTENTILHYHKLLSSILSTAVKWQVLFSNPCERVDPPKVRKKEAVSLDEEQVQTLLSLLDNEPMTYRTMITLLLYTGMRRGELCGLEWNDIDLNRGLLDIQRSSLYLPEKGVFVDDTKTNSSKRVLKLTEDAVRLLREYQAWQTEARQGATWNESWTEHPRLFTTKEGIPLHPSTVTGWFHKFVERNGLPPISIHSLRHTNASLLIAAGTNIRTVSAHLGHSQTSTTVDIYAHAIKSAEAAAADALQGMLSRQEKKE